MRIIALLMCLSPLVLMAADPSVEPPRKPAQAKKKTALELVAEEEKWQFTPTVGRQDVFVDIEQLFRSQKQVRLQNQAPDPSGRPLRPGEQPTGADVDQLLSWAHGEEQRVKSAVAGRRYDEAMKVADGAIKPLEPHLSRADVSAVVVSIRTYRAQAEEAKVRDDAQAAFDSLRLKVLGVLWSQDGARMAILDGETRALAVNDRVKDCVIINIDQDRVDFRYHFGRRRFEFPVYVDQVTARSQP